MSCRSEEKVLCPWCGAEMLLPVYVGWTHLPPDKGGYNWHQCAECPNCGANAPEGYGRTLEEAKEAARDAALRLYTPALKPMTLEEVKGANRAWIEVMAEGRDMQFVEMNKRSGGVVYQTPGSEQLYGVLYDNYGKTWRCWERKPTDEEREAATWETD